MKKLVCEICGGANIAKENGVFVCKDCGCQYADADVKKLLVEVDGESIPSAVVTESNATPQKNSKLQNLYDVARRAKDNDNSEQAAEYYDLILREDPNNWEPVFYTVYFNSMQCKIANIASAAISLRNSIESVVELIKNENTGNESKELNLLQVAQDSAEISRMLASAAYNHYNGIAPAYREDHSDEYVNRLLAVEAFLVELSGSCVSFFGEIKTTILIRMLVCETLATIFGTDRAKECYKLKNKSPGYRSKYRADKALLEQLDFLNKVRKNKQEFYEVASKDMASDDIATLEVCCDVFTELKDYKDSDEKLKQCRNKILEIKYNCALASYEKGDYHTAASGFKVLGDFKDSKTKISDCISRIQESEKQAEEAKRQAEEENRIKKKKKKTKIKIICLVVFLLVPAIAFGVLFGPCITCHKSFTDVKTFVTGDNYTIAVKNDGTVVSTGHPLFDGYYTGLDGVNDIVKIVYPDHLSLYALRANGTVVCKGREFIDIRDWTDIVDVAATDNFAVGVKSDGTVVIKYTEYYEENYAQVYDVSDWTDVVAVAVGGSGIFGTDSDYYITGLKSDGTVVGCGCIGKGDGITEISNYVEGLTDVVSIAASETFVAVYSDGTIDTFGKLHVNGKDYVQPTKINNVKSASVSSTNIAYLLNDGTVVVFGDNQYGQCEVSEWTDIVAVSTNYNRVVGLKSDGTLVAVGDNMANRCNVDEDNIRLDGVFF